jgi:hypothetical protein
MPWNELEAIKMIDEGKITDDEIKILTQTRNGVAAEDHRDNDKNLDKDIQELLDRGLLYIVPLSHPRASLTVDAIVPTEAGTTVLNLFDKRYRENTNASPDANTAPEADPKLVKHPTDEEARKVPSIETKPLTSEEKQLETPPIPDAAADDEAFQTGGKDLSDVKEEKTIDLAKAKVVVEGGASFDHDGNGKVGGSKKKSSATADSKVDR